MATPPTFIVAQLGARRHYAVPRILHESGILERLYTDICAVKGWPRALRAVPDGLQPTSLKRLLGRVPRGIPSEKITAFTGFGMLYERRRRRARTAAQSMTLHLWAAQRFCQKVISNGGISASGVYTFNGAGLELLQRAADNGLPRIIEQTSAPTEVQRRLLELEEARFPEWKMTCEGALSLNAWSTRERQEWAISDRIVCGSEFVRTGIAQCGGPVDRCVVVPYGVENRFECPIRAAHNGPLRVLTVGTIGLIKGSPYVLAAAVRLGTAARFRICGTLNAPAPVIKELDKRVELMGRVPRTDIKAHLEWADVFLLPSVSEGSATVIYEALTAGLPVICTPNTGSIVRDGVNGIIVPSGDVDAIVATLERLASSRATLAEFQENVRLTVRDASLEAYSQRLIAAISCFRS
jgi:glycosyltransferase involved in cell wall biosynthesis